MQSLGGQNGVLPVREWLIKTRGRAIDGQWPTPWPSSTQGFVDSIKAHHQKMFGTVGYDSYGVLNAHRTGHEQNGFKYPNKAGYDDSDEKGVPV